MKKIYMNLDSKNKICSVVAKEASKKMFRVKTAYKNVECQFGISRVISFSLSILTQVALSLKIFASFSCLIMYTFDFHL